MSPLEIRRILVPTDFSVHSRKALRYARGLAVLVGAEVTVLHVLDRRVVENVYHIHDLTPERAREQMRSAAEREMEKLLAEEGEGGRPRTMFAEGIPAPRVKEVAEEIGADLIVMGTHGRTGLTHLLYGSTAEGVVRGAPCPVLTVNP